MTRTYDTLLSRMGTGLQGSAIRQMGIMAAGRADLISFAPGYPDPEVFAWEAYRAIADDLLSRQSPSTLQYSPTRGLPSLIEAIVPLAQAQDIRCGPDDVLITTGSQQGIDLLARVLLDPGDVVLVELPTFTGAIAAFRSAHARLVGVRQDGDGVDVEHFRSVVARERSAGRRLKFCYLVPNFQNPSGTLMSSARRHALLQAAIELDVLLVEDDPYGDLFFDADVAAHDVRPIKAADATGQVVYLRSTSKTFAPGFRTAWLIGPAPIVARLDVAKQSADLCSSGLDQSIVREAIQRGVVTSRLPMLRDRYRQRRDVMLTALRASASSLFSPETPRGGFFVWGALRNGTDAQALVAQALAAGVVYVPGAPFFVDGTGTSYLRLAYSSAPLDRIAEGVSRLAAVMQAAEAASTP
jgi:2-aminoadipate transaminase